MNIDFDKRVAVTYKSFSQQARVLTEDWVSKQIYCPNCGSAQLGKYSNNRPVADFFCQQCREDFELKSKKGLIGEKIIDGAYRTMIERLQSNNNPNFFFLNYNLKSLDVMNFFVIPKHFFVPQIIEKRKPLSGRIFLVKNAHVELKQKVLRDWKKTLFLREGKDIKSKGWIIDVMNCIDQLAKKEFTLDEIYSFENNLKQKHPNNRYIKDKIRQQLQFLRDKGYLDFIAKGQYRVV